MNPKELVLCITRKNLEEKKKFQGFLPTNAEESQALFPETALTDGTLSFQPRGSVEEDPSFKQIIPYCIILQTGKILIYSRGKAGGEAKLHAKQSVGVGGHINPEDRKKEADAPTPFLTALLRELDEEISLPDSSPIISIRGLINDDSNPVGSVHLGVVVVIEVNPGSIKSKEDALHSLRLIDPTDLHQEENLESWSQIVADHINEIIPSGEILIDTGNSSTGTIGLSAVVTARGEKEALTILQEALPETLKVKTGHPRVSYANVYINNEAIQWGKPDVDCSNGLRRLF